MPTTGAAAATGSNSDLSSNKLLTSPKLSSVTAVPLDDLLQRFISFSQNEGQKFVEEFEVNVSCIVGPFCRLVEINPSDAPRQRIVPAPLIRDVAHI